MSGYTRGSGRQVLLGSALGSGGEARVFAVHGEPNLVAKIYHWPSPLHATKLRAMLANPPADPTRGQGHISIAWPTDVVLDRRGMVAGFLMPRVDVATSIPVLELYNPRDRLEKAPTFTWAYLLRAARNLASAVESVHARGYVIGDINESNVLVANTALVTLVDCDSMQVPVAHGPALRCSVGKPEYTPPELQGKDFSAADRRPASDNFGLAVLTFMLLMEGVHPFAGIWKGRGDAPTLEQNIRTGACPYAGFSAVTPPRYALPFTTLAPGLQALVRRCFGAGQTNPAARPTAQEWRQVLSNAEQTLSQCRTNGQHRYGRHLSACPWCLRVQQGLQDPFPAPGAQAPLPAIDFRRGSVCPACKYTNGAGEIYCQRCARQLRPNRYCAQCGAIALTYGQFCIGCGFKL